MAMRISADGQDLIRTTNLPSGNLFTVCCWGKIQTDRNTWSTLFSIDNGTGNYNYVQTDSDGLIFKAFDDTVGIGITLFTATLDRWFFCAVSKSDAGAGYGYYANAGSSLNQVSIGSCLDTLTAGNLRIGESPYGGEWLNGSIAAVKVWSAALTRAEIQAEMMQIMPVRTADLNTFLPLITSPFGSDFSGNKYYMTVNGTPAISDGPPIPMFIRHRSIFIPAAAAGGANTLSVTMAGGAVAGGAATTAFQKTSSVTMAGGAVAGGAATVAKQKTFSFTASGGAVAGGAATFAVQRSRSVTMAGGAVAGGAATASFIRSLSVSAAGGAVAGGAATIAHQKTLSVTMSGGGLAGGTAPVVFDNGVQSYLVTMSGGAVAEGAATVAFQKTKSVAMEGGAVAGGASTVALNKTFSLTMDGGAVVGSAATIQRAMHAAMSGGCTSGGAAALKKGLVFSAGGGGIFGGHAVYLFQSLTGQSLTVTMSGGAVAGGDAGLFGVYAWPRPPVTKSGGIFGAGSDITRSDLDQLERKILRQVMKSELALEERVIVAAVKFFMEQSDRWAA